MHETPPTRKSKTVRRARSLRREMTLPEVIMWQLLRRRPDGLKFRRQHPSGPYILDFFCADAQLAIEIDGDNHNFLERIEYDQARDAWFARAGIATLRIAARDVLKDSEAVLDYVIRETKRRLPLHRTACGPPPQASLREE